MNFRKLAGLLLLLLPFGAFSQAGPSVSIGGSIGVTGGASREGLTTVIMSADADRVLTPAEWWAGTIVIESSVPLTTTRYLIAPPNGGQKFVVENLTQGNQPLIVVAVSGTIGAYVQNGHAITAAFDGDNYIATSVGLGDDFLTDKISYGVALNSGVLCADTTSNCNSAQFIQNAIVRPTPTTETILRAYQGAFVDPGPTPTYYGFALGVDAAIPYQPLLKASPFIINGYGFTSYLTTPGSSTDSTHCNAVLANLVYFDDNFIYHCNNAGNLISKTKLTASGVSGLNFTGNYNSSTTYNAGDAVAYTDGTSYVSIAGGNIGNTPSSASTYWQILAKQGIAGPIAPSGFDSQPFIAVTQPALRNLFYPSNVIANTFEKADGSLNAYTGYNVIRVYTGDATQLIANFPIQSDGNSSMVSRDITQAIVATTPAQTTSGPGGNSFPANTVIPLTGNQTFTDLTYYGLNMPAIGPMVYASISSRGPPAIPATYVPPFGVPSATGKAGSTIYVESASIGAGYTLSNTNAPSGGGTAGAFPYLIATSPYFAGATYWNNGVPGKNDSQSLAQYSSNTGTNAGNAPSAHSLSPAVTGMPGYYFLIMDNAYNSATQGTAVSEATSISNQTALYNAAHADGWVVVRFTSNVTMNPTAPYAVNQQILDLNADARNGTIPSDILIDNAEVIPNQLDPTFYNDTSSDHVHPNAAGHAALGAYDNYLFATGNFSNKAQLGFHTVPQAFWGGASIYDAAGNKWLLTVNNGTVTATAQ